MSELTVLKEAHTIIYGDREKTYGHPAKNLKTIAKMWNAYLVACGVATEGEGELIDKDVASMMILLKTARLEIILTIVILWWTSVGMPL
jgi:hypothetical protein